MPVTSPEKRSRLARALFALFALALIMGPGPGILLVNPAPGDPQSARFFLGIPVIFAWAVFWFGVQALTVVLAYVLIWRKPAP